MIESPHSFQVNGPKGKGYVEALTLSTEKETFLPYLGMKVPRDSGVVTIVVAEESVSKDLIS